MRPSCFSWLLALAVGCAGADGPVTLDIGPPPGTTGLEGVVRRGPIQPVCRPELPCDAPFSARFDVRAGERVVARFTSDSAGRFVVSLAPGPYTVVPDASAALLGAAWQTHAVTVDPTGLTHVELEFDTGIR